ncbi:MAG: GvpL/GvpF family gas vesicle protein [Actinomycetes bacterium]
MRYLYAVLDSQARVPGLRGVGGTGVEPVRYTDLLVLSGDVPPDLVAHPDANALWAHDQVVEAVTSRADAVLPMPFGTTLRDVPHAVTFLSAHHDVLARGLDRVRGHVEVGVRAVAQGSPAAPAPEGSASASVHDPLAGLCRGYRRATVVHGATVLAAAYLVPRDRLDDFRALARHLSRTQDVSVVCTGPWPPYSFTPSETGNPAAAQVRWGALTP